MKVGILKSCPLSATAEQTACRARAHFIMGSRGQLPQTRHFTQRDPRPLAREVPNPGQLAIRKLSQNFVVLLCGIACGSLTGEGGCAVGVARHVAAQFLRRKSGQVSW